MIKGGDKFLQDLKDATEVRRKKREFLMILCQPEFKIDKVSLYVLQKEEKN